MPSPPGPHTALFWARDMAGNRSEQSVAFVRDGTRPTVALSADGHALDVTVTDAESRTGSLNVAARRRDRSAARAAHAAADVRRGHRDGEDRRPLPLARGRLRVRVQAFDEVGHPSTVSTAGLAPGLR